MLDIPMHTSPNGVFTMRMGAVALAGKAYCLVHAVEPGKTMALMKEAATFCMMTKIDKLYASECEGIDVFPLHAKVLEMQCIAKPDPELVCGTYPVTCVTAPDFRNAMNLKLRKVDCTMFLEREEESSFHLNPNAFYIHDHGKLIGMAMMNGPELRMMCSIYPGAGERLMHTIMSKVEGQLMTLQVASTNEKALRLYEKVGFQVTRVLETWYQIYPSAYFMDKKAALRKFYG